MSRPHSAALKPGVALAGCTRYGIRLRVMALDRNRQISTMQAMVIEKVGQRLGSSAPLGNSAVARKNTRKHSSQPVVSPIHRKKVLTPMMLERSR